MTNKKTIYKVLPLHLHMSVKLVHSSQSPSQTESLQDMVAYCARVSNPANQHNTESNPKLLQYLIKNQHWSPFEMVSICLEINTTRDIARQILRHRSFSFQEFSQRYAQVNESFMTREARLQDHKNRQNSICIQDQQLQTEWEQRQQYIGEQAKETYEWALENGIAKEQARAVLPEGMTPSTLYMNGTLRSWIHYIQVRTEKGTQKEHRAVALAAAVAIMPLFPLIEEFVSNE
jgi:thymidylate synthase (FAD)